MLNRDFRGGGPPSQPKGAGKSTFPREGVSLTQPLIPYHETAATQGPLVTQTVALSVCVVKNLLVGSRFLLRSNFKV